MPCKVCQRPIYFDSERETSICARDQIIAARRFGLLVYMGTLALPWNHKLGVSIAWSTS